MEIVVKHSFWVCGGGTDVKWLFTELAGGQLRKLALCTFLPACFLSSSSFLLPFLLLALLCTLLVSRHFGPPCGRPWLWSAHSQWTHSCLDNDNAVLPWRHVTAFCSASSSFWAKTGESSGWNEMIPLRASGDEHKHSFDFLWNHFYIVTFLWQNKWRWKSLRSAWKASLLILSNVNVKCDTWGWRMSQLIARRSQGGDLWVLWNIWFCFFCSEFWL